MSNERKVRFITLRNLRPQRADEKVIVEKDGDGVNGLYTYNNASRSWCRIAVKDINGEWQSPNVAKDIPSKNTSLQEAAQIVKDMGGYRKVADALPSIVEASKVLAESNLKTADVVNGNGDVIGVVTNDPEKPFIPVKVGQNTENDAVQEINAADSLGDEQTSQEDVVDGDVTDNPLSETNPECVADIQEDIPTSQTAEEQVTAPAEVVGSNIVINQVNDGEVSVVDGSDITPFERMSEQPKQEESAPPQVEPEPVKSKPVQQPQMTVQQKIAAARLKLTQSAFTK